MSSALNKALKCQQDVEVCLKEIYTEILPFPTLPFIFYNQLNLEDDDTREHRAAIIIKHSQIILNSLLDQLLQLPR